MTSRRPVQLIVSTAAMVVALVAACGPSPATTPAPARPTVGPVVATAPTEAGNRRAAQREADRLIAAARLPAHAVRVPRAPTGLPGPVVEPAVSSLLVRSTFWTVPSPFSAALASLRADPPAGLAAPSTSTGSGPHLQVAGLVYPLATVPGWGSADYEVQLSRLTADTTGVRVDAVVTWLDPRPVSDGAPGPRLRVTVGEGCPATDTGVVGVLSPGPSPDEQLVPRDQPTAARVCSYSGTNGARPSTLTRSRSFTPAQARDLATAVAAVPLGHTAGSVSSCPADVGDAVVVALRYPGRDDVDLWYPTSGCARLANGHVAAVSFVPGPVLTALGR